MRRRRSILVLSLPGLLGAGYFGCGLGACWSGEVVDLGADLDARVPDATSVPESGPERDGSLADRADSSPPDDASDAMDEPPLPPGTVCLENPSFERHLPGDAQASQPVQSMPLGWAVCAGVTANSSSCGLPPTNQDSYVGLSVGLVAPFVYGPASISSPLCAPLEVGTTYALTVDYGLDTPVPDAAGTGEPPALQNLGRHDEVRDEGATLEVRFAPGRVRMEEDLPHLRTLGRVQLHDADPRDERLLRAHLRAGLRHRGQPPRVADLPLAPGCELAFRCRLAR